MLDKEIRIAPDFTAKDAENRQIKLSDFRDKKNVMLVFNRGFTWPYCRKHMAQLREEYPQFKERNTEIIAIGPEDAGSFADWWHKNQMPFIGIADPEHIIANLYGQQVKLLKLGRMPASVLIDKKGQIRYSHFGASMADIPPVQEMLGLIDRLSGEETG